MKPSFERHSAEFGIKKENLKNRELPVVTAYIIRHGETTEDKLNPNRGLTLEGENQADEAAERLISELNPATDVIQILDSGNYRANATVMRIAQKLKSAGFKFFNSKLYCSQIPCKVIRSLIRLSQNRWRILSTWKFNNQGSFAFSS